MNVIECQWIKIEDAMLADIMDLVKEITLMKKTSRWQLDECVGHLDQHAEDVVQTR